MTLWQRFKTSQENQAEQLQKLNKKIEEHQLDYWTEKLEYVRWLFGLKPSSDGRVQMFSLHKEKPPKKEG